ncbi:hypothetical protein CH276_27965 [Rhodococcus sp. 06-470-2]|uniref:hypothetical protein n=1 Tax=unclassified Rhodococcus (in: high G+C Gram-positive bacteria) TaxID=192944 RepID=UPI000B9B2F5B|nr:MULTISPECIES: hypothetical protein [unclassified Rhodococcus (in: high G+C Gram-positive bacteria)]OZC55945.1 hypothetical protein CH276_27965 [Rhodococcus sp. 06-470-2]OZE64825.1 hypothetical protein CH265_10285 [Rhodococcus sp. 05-2221-1B]
MSKAEITAETLTEIIKTAGHNPRDFDIKGTLAHVKSYNKEQDQEAAEEGWAPEYIDLETVTEWLDETGPFGTYVLCPWLTAA